MPTADHVQDGPVLDGRWIAQFQLGKDACFLLGKQYRQSHEWRPAMRQSARKTSIANVCFWHKADILNR